MARIATLQDLETLEARGLAASFPQRSAWEILAEQARSRPHATAIRYLHDAADPARDAVVTYAGLAARVEGAARLFRAHGVRPGRGVAILTQHTVSGQVALWGAEVAGHACPINPLLKPDHIAALILASDAAVVVAMGVNAEMNYWPTLVPALRAEGIALPIFACDAEADSPGADGVFERLIATPGDPIRPEGDETALAACYHTGGTTGAPKLVRHLRGNQAHVARSCALMHDLKPSDVVVNGFPLFHVAGAFVYGLSTLCAGGTQVIPGRLGMRNPAFMETLWHQVERLGITIVGAVPTVLAGLKGRAVDADISTLRWFLTGGSPLPTELAETIETQTGVAVRNILGMTECAGAIAVEPVHGPRVPLSCGLRLPFTELAILDETDGEADPARPLPPGETGIIALRGPNVADGYSDPTLGAGSFLPGGWLVSGDLGMLDTAGRLFITGRKKDMIIRGAHNIDPQMIEDALLAHPEVSAAAAVGMPDAYAGELPAAFVTLRAGAEATGEALVAFLRDRLEDPVALPRWVAVIEAMPLTPVGKIFKPTLRAEATRRAFEAAAAKAGIAAHVTVGAEGTEIRVAEADAPAIREALAGMPVAWRVTAG